jgi:hypothetical protein
MRAIFLILMFLTVFGSCKSSSDNSKEALADYDMLPIPIDSSVHYFNTKPDYKDTTANALTAFVNTWYSKMLLALKEPIIKNYQGSKEIYRFTWLRDLNHPVSIRLEKQGALIKLFTKVSNGSGDYDPGDLIVDKITDVTLQEYNELLGKIELAEFWTLPTVKQGESVDGSEWIIEVASNNRYHLVTRKMPFVEAHGNYRIIGQYLISLAQLDKIETEVIY